VPSGTGRLVEARLNDSDTVLPRSVRERRWTTGSPPMPTIVYPTSSAERRQLTVMFCDLVGSTELSVRLDPEDLREVIVAYQTYVAETVARFGGFVAKYMGDGMLVYFGYPRAHEHDAEHAIRAGLALVRALNERDWPSNIVAQIRVGIATGLVVVGDLGVAQEHGIVGETPNLAARLQALAEPNTVVIASSTRRLTGGLFDYRDLGAMALKGFVEDVQAWQVTGPSTAEILAAALGCAVRHLPSVCSSTLSGMPTRATVQRSHRHTPTCRWRSMTSSEH
jgi:class 3 adenylate cyclase